MNGVLRLFKWLFGAAVFLLLFAFALNNQEKVQVHLVFGWSGETPLVLVILLAFAVGMVTGVLGMLPHWWRQRRNASVGIRHSVPATPGSDTLPAARTRPAAPPIKASPSTDFEYGP